MFTKDCTNCRYLKDHVSNNNCTPMECIPKRFAYWAPAIPTGGRRITVEDIVDSKTCISCFWCTPVYGYTDNRDRIVCYICWSKEDKIKLIDQSDYVCSEYEED